LLRRQSLLAAALDPGKELYFWGDLSAPTLRQAADPNARNTCSNDERLAMCGLYELATLGNLLNTDSGNKRIADAAAEFAVHENAQEEDVDRKLRNLLIAHRDEWRNFIALQKSESFLNSWLEILQC
jgi:hypothetical protein